jgi:hypothetical protein
VRLEPPRGVVGAMPRRMGEAAMAVGLDQRTSRVHAGAASIDRALNLSKRGQRPRGLGGNRYL